MENEKKEKEKEIVVLDEGIDIDSVAGPRGVCCWVMLMPLWG
ncbi:hypothetical protein ACFLZM_01145 [Thermodesulfobacteriota bacterium]